MKPWSPLHQHQPQQGQQRTESLAVVPQWEVGGGDSPGHKSLPVGMATYLKWLVHFPLQVDFVKSRAWRCCRGKSLTSPVKSQTDPHPAHKRNRRMNRVTRGLEWTAVWNTTEKGGGRPNCTGWELQIKLSLQSWPTHAAKACPWSIDGVPGCQNRD